jgi:hypothetical protein
MRLRHRIAALERKVLVEPVALYFADGTSVPITGPGDFLLKLVAAACCGEHSSHADLISRSVRADEPGGGNLVGLVRALLNGPSD